MTLALIIFQKNKQLVKTQNQKINKDTRTTPERIKNKKCTINP